MNSFQSKMIKKQRESLIKNKGQAKDSNFIDKRLEMQRESNKMFMENAKRK